MKEEKALKRKNIFVSPSIRQRILLFYRLDDFLMTHFQRQVFELLKMMVQKGMGGGRKMMKMELKTEGGI